MLVVADDRLRVASFVVPFGTAARPVAGVVAMHVAGSLHPGRDFQPGISDLDLVAIIEAELDEQPQDRLIELDRTTIRADTRRRFEDRLAEQLRMLGWLERDHIGYRVGMRLFEPGGRGRGCRGAAAAARCVRVAVSAAR